MKTRKHKIASIVLLMVFFSQQISWACGYNLSLLVNPPSSSLIYQDHGQFNLWVARRVYSLAKPSFRHKTQELKSAYQWLKTPATETVPCSAYVLYNLLQAKGIKPKIEDISASLISLDLKAGNLKPPFTQNRIDNSLYAMAKTAESQGLTLYPARLNSITPQFLNSQTLKLLNSQTPFIAHLSYGGQSGHFVLVTKIDTEKVYFFYDKGDTFLPYEKFLEEFSGYCLLSAFSLQLSAGQKTAVGPTIAQAAFTLASDSEAKSILGAGRSYHGRSVNISGVFKKPSSIESVIGIASSIGGAFFMPSGNLWATAAGAGIQVGGGLLFKDSMWGRIATGVAAGAVSGGLSGSTFKGALGLSWGFKEAGIGAAKGLGMSGTIEGIKAMNFGDASLRASIANLLAIPVGQAIEGGLSAKFGATIDGIDYKKETSGSFWKGAWMGATFQRSLTNKADGWKRWAPAIAYYGGQSASIAVEAFGPKKYSSLYSTGISTAFNALTNVAAMGQGDKLWKVLGKSVADGALRGGLSIGLQKLTKDMRITEGAFLEMAGASLISAGVESAFGKWSGESAVSRKGIFWDNLQKSWKGAMQDVVTFGAAKGYMLGTSGAYAFLKMNELGSNVGKARASGLSAFDSAHWAFNQHVGSTYHNAAVNTLSSMVWNRVDNVKYMRWVDGEIHEIKLQSLSKFTNDKDLLKSGGTAIYDLTAQKYIPQTFTYDDKSTGIVKSISIGESGLLPADYSSDDNNDPIFMSDNEFLKIERKLLRDKIRGKYKISKNMKGLRDPAFTKEDFMIKYPEVEKELKETVLFNPRRKAALTYELHKTWHIAYERFLAEEKNGPKNVVKLPVQKRDNDSTTKTWKVVHDKGDSVFKMKGKRFIGDGQVVGGAPDITVRYDPKAVRYEVVVDKKKFKVDRVEDFVTVGDEKLRRVMEAGSTLFPDVEGGLPNAIPGKDLLELKDDFEQLALELKKGDKIILNSNQDLETDQSQHAKGNFPLFPGYQLKPGAIKAEKIPGYDEEIKGRMIYGNTKEDPAVMSKQRKDGSVEFNFVGDVSDVFKIEGIKAQGERFKIEEELSPTSFVEFVDKIKWNQGARAAESLPDGRTTYTETMVKESEIGKSWEEKTTTVLDIRRYGEGAVYYSNAEGNKLKVSENKSDSNKIEVDRITGGPFGDYRAEEGKKILEYKPVQGDLIELSEDGLKISRAQHYASPDVIEGMKGLDVEGLRYVDNKNIRLQKSPENDKVDFYNVLEDEVVGVAPQELSKRWNDFNEYKFSYTVNEKNELQPSLIVSFKDNTTKAYPIADFKSFMPKTSPLDVAIISPASVPTPLPVASETATATSSPTLTPVASPNLKPTPTQITPAASSTATELKGAPDINNSKNLLSQGSGESNKKSAPMDMKKTFSQLNSIAEFAAVNAKKLEWDDPFNVVEIKYNEEEKDFHLKKRVTVVSTETGEEFEWIGPVLIMHGYAEGGKLYASSNNKLAGDVLKEYSKEHGIKEILLISCNYGKGSVDVPEGMDRVVYAKSLVFSEVDKGTDEQRKTGKDARDARINALDNKRFKHFAETYSELSDTISESVPLGSSYAFATGWTEKKGRKNGNNSDAANESRSVLNPRGGEQSEGLIKEALDGVVRYKPYNGSNYPPAGLESEGLDEFYSQQQNNDYSKLNQVSMGTQEKVEASPSFIRLAANGIGEGSAGNKYIQGFIRNEPDTMSDVGQPIISMDKISQAPKVDLQEMSSAQYDKLLSDIDNSGQADVETMVQHALSPSQMLKDNYGVSKTADMDSTQRTDYYESVIKMSDAEKKQLLEDGEYTGVFVPLIGDKVRAYNKNNDGTVILYTVNGDDEIVRAKKVGKNFFDESLRSPTSNSNLYTILGYETREGFRDNTIMPEADENTVGRITQKAMTDLEVSSPDGRKIENIYIEERKFGSNAPTKSQLVKTNITIPPSTIERLVYNNEDYSGYVSTGRGTGTISFERTSFKKAPVHIYTDFLDPPGKSQKDFTDDLAFIDPNEFKITGDKVQLTKKVGPITQQTIFEDGKVKSSRYYIQEAGSRLAPHGDEYRAVASNGYEVVFAPLNRDKFKVANVLNKGINEYGQFRMTPRSGLKGFRIMSGNEIKPGEYIDGIKLLPQRTRTNK